jgi:glycosyltransferase involved in cell wall biosynthesis
MAANIPRSELEIMKLNSKGRKILVLTDFFFPDSTGGANKMAYYSSKGLSENGSTVVVITRKAEPDLLDQQILFEMSICRYEWNTRNPIRSLWRARNKIQFYLDALYREDLKPFDLVIAHQPLTARLIGAHSLILGSPWLYNFHSPWGEEFMIKAGNNGDVNLGHKIRTAVISKLLYRIERNTLQRCRKIIVLSQFMRSKLAKLHGQNDKIELIPGGVDTQTFKPAADRKRVREELGLSDDKIILLTVRNLRPRMGLSNLIKAISLCGPLRSKLHLIIAGSGQLAEMLKNQSETLGLSSEITFPGKISEEDLIRYYQAADLFILPTRKLEGFGLATLEALASGLPVIGTPVGATPEIISQFGKGWLCEDSSATSLAQKISDRVNWFIDHPQKYHFLRQHLHTTANQKYGWPNIISQWESVCSAICP